MAIPTTGSDHLPLSALVRETVADFRKVAQRITTVLSEETRRSALAARTAVAFMAAGGSVALAGLVTLAYAAGIWLQSAAPGMPVGAAPAIVGVAVLGLSVVLVVLGKQRLAAVEQLHKESAKVLKEANMVAQDVSNAVYSVTQSVQDKVDSVKDAVDLPHQVEVRPWTMIAGALTVGFVAGHVHLPRGNGSGNGSSHVGHAPARPMPNADPEPGWLHKVADTLSPELDTLKGIAVGALLGLAREMAVTSAPRLAGPQLEELMGVVAKRFGAKVPPASQSRQQPAGAPRANVSNAHAHASGATHGVE